MSSLWYYYFPVVLNDLFYNNLCYFFVVVSKYMSNRKVKLYIGSGTSMFVNVVSCVAYLSIMRCTNIWCENAHATSFLWLFKNCYIFWNHGFVCICCQNIGLIKVLIFSIVKVWSTTPSQLKKRLIKSLVSIICPMVNSHFLDCMSIPMLRNDNDWT